MSRIRDVFEGLIILEKYKDSGVAAEHEVIFAGPPGAQDVTPEDSERLKQFGWFIDDENDSWARYT